MKIPQNTTSLPSRNGSRNKFQDFTKQRISSNCPSAKENARKSGAICRLSVTLLLFARLAKKGSQQCLKTQNSTQHETLNSKLWLLTLDLHLYLYPHARFRIDFRLVSCC